ncbi:MAG TPA: carbon-nitrogen hydrolase family protein [Synergistales bacterium]|nr:carbon-nitrogen hydrolase family protein [Synergistales bacterium]
MVTPVNSVKVAVVQAAPVFMDKEGTLRKALDLVETCGKQDARIIVFPEAFIPAYPRGLSFGAVVGSRSPEGRKDFRRYFENSVDVPSETTVALGQAAKKHGAYLVMGVVEREGGTLYCTILYFGPDGSLLGKHRKLKPTASERIIWGEGDGSTLTVLDTPYGKMGGLICWENYMPLARAAIYGKGATLYLAPTADSREEWQSTIRHIALEGRCFVISVNQYVNKSIYPADLACYGDLKDLPEEMCSGGSAILGPLGQYLAGPVRGREEILVADLDLGLIGESRFDFDVIGHYARPDVLSLSVNEGPMTSVSYCQGYSPGKENPTGQEDQGQ